MLLYHKFPFSALLILNKRLLFWVSGLRQPSAHQDFHHGGHHQVAGPAAGVSETKQMPDAGVEVAIHDNPVGIELDFRSIQEDFRAGKAGNYHVHGLDEVNDIYHGAVWQCGGNVAGDCVRKGRADVGAIQLLLPGALATHGL